MKYAIILGVVITLISAYGISMIYDMQQEIALFHTRLSILEDERKMLHIPMEVNQATEEVYQLTLYFIQSTPTDFLLVPVIRHTTVPPAPLEALTHLINGPLDSEELVPAVPQTTKIHSLTISNGLATVDLSKDIRTGFVGGAQLESHMIFAIVNTLTQFEPINQVQILLDGEMVETIAGHVTIDHPLP